MASEDRPRDPAGKPKSGQIDPLEDPTQSMSVNERPPSPCVPAPKVSDSSDTTTWAGAPPPNVALEEAETIVSPIPQGSEVDPENTETLITGAQVDPPPSAPIAPSSSLRPMLLERIEPSLGRGKGCVSTPRIGGSHLVVPKRAISVSTRLRHHETMHRSPEAKAGIGC